MTWKSDMAQMMLVRRSERREWTKRTQKSGLQELPTWEDTAGNLKRHQSSAGIPPPSFSQGIKTSHRWKWQWWASLLAN